MPKTTTDLTWPNILIGLTVRIGIIVTIILLEREVPEAHRLPCVLAVLLAFFYPGSND